MNACALKNFPYYLEKDFGVPRTVAKTIQVPQRVKVTRKIRVAKRVKVKGTWVTRYHVETRVSYITRYVTKTVSVDNVDFTNLVAAANLFYSKQPAPYNTGTCW